MHNDSQRAITSLHDLAASIIRAGAKTGDPELIFLGTSISHLLRICSNPIEREAMSKSLTDSAVKRLMRAAGAREEEIVLMDWAANSCAN